MTPTKPGVAPDDVHPLAGSRRAFTVPELLAVVAILVIIISILLPNLGQGREVAREAVCKSNLHQIAVASRNYGTDTGYMPNAYTSNYIVWVPSIYGYVNRDPNIFYCPTAPPQAKWAGIQTGGGLPGGLGYRDNEMRILINEFFSYGHNNGGSADSSIPSLGVGDYVDLGEPPTRPNRGWNRIAIVAAPSNFIMYGDSTVDGLWDHFIDEDYEDGAGRTEYPADRHRGGCHLGFGDGHVEYQLQMYVYHLGPVGTVLPEMRRRWNNDNLPH
jgi:prepilin-type N-terminal cleavage/methylation domain-containing protein/prepilin-type processing-associated H-X9-DG protein